MQASAVSRETYFRKFPKELTITEKIKYTVELYNNNYFIDRDVRELDYIDEHIRPMQTVPRTYLREFKDQVAKNKKLSWVFARMDSPFAEEFKQQYEAAAFSSVRDAIQMACRIYAANCSDYKQAQSTVYSQNGVKCVTKKRFHSEHPGGEKEQGEVVVDEAEADFSYWPSEEADTTEPESDLKRFKTSAIQHIISKRDEIIQMAALSSEDMLANISAPTEAMSFARELYGQTDVNRLDGVSARTAVHSPHTY